jgi:predicted outer membrane protein
MRLKVITIALGALCGVCVGPGLAAQGIPVAPPDTVGDAHILGLRAVVDQQEIETARWAASHTKSRQVKDFTASLLRGHTNAQNTAAALADRLHIERRIPADSNAAIVTRHQVTMASLRRLSGAEFDRVFLQAIRDEHASEIDKVNNWYGPAAKNDSVKAYLTAIMPTLVKHRDTATRLLGTKSVAAR